MLYVAERGGGVLRLDPGDPVDLGRLAALAREPGRVTSVSLACGGVRVDLPIPRGLAVAGYDAEVVRTRDGIAVAERVSALVRLPGGPLRFSLTVYDGSGRVRADISRVPEPALDSLPMDLPARGT